VTRVRSTAVGGGYCGAAAWGKRRANKYFDRLAEVVEHRFAELCAAADVVGAADARDGQ
jgi:hypothetical protein